jgi:hypothetical protein
MENSLSPMSLFLKDYLNSNLCGRELRADRMKTVATVGGDVQNDDCQRNCAEREKIALPRILRIARRLQVQSLLRG